jgi:hypothetical protein
MAKCERCFQGTYYGGECRQCRGRGEVFRRSIGPVQLTVAALWKPNRHARWLAGEEYTPMLRHNDKGELIVADLNVRGEQQP